MRAVRLSKGRWINPDHVVEVVIAVSPRYKEDLRKWDQEASDTPNASMTDLVLRLRRGRPEKAKYFVPYLYLSDGRQTYAEDWTVAGLLEDLYGVDFSPEQFEEIDADHEQ